jgi:hypothetical protein
LIGEPCRRSQEYQSIRGKENTLIGEPCGHPQAGPCRRPQDGEPCRHPEEKGANEEYPSTRGQEEVLDLMSLDKMKVACGKT